MTHTHPTTSTKAFTLPEVLLAMVLLTIGLTSVIMLFPIGARMQSEAVNDTAGRAFAESALASLHANANYMFANNAGLANPAVIPPNPTGMTIILSTNTALPILTAPSGNYAYRACYWQPYVNGRLATGHLNAAVFAFNAATPGELAMSTNGKVVSTANGLTTFSIFGLTTFSPDQVALVQDTNSTHSPNFDVYTVRVVNFAGNTVTVSPALPLVANDAVVFVYLPQRAVSVATGSIR